MTIYQNYSLFGWVEELIRATEDKKEKEDIF